MAVTSYCKRSYAQDTAAFPTVWLKSWIAMLVGLVMIMPWMISNYVLSILIICGVNCLAALGLNILTGCTGQISLGHSAFMAVGAYTYALTVSKIGVPFYLGLALAGLVSALIGLIVGLPSLRLKGFYLAIATMAFYFISEHVFYHWTGLTNGPGGLQIPRPTWGWGSLESDTAVYFLTYGCLAALMVYARNLLNCRLGRAFVAIRDSDISAKVIGVDLTRYKLYSFMISSFYAGVAGGLLALYLRFINPELFTLSVSIQYIGMIIVGGMGSILGSLLGAVFLTALPECLRWATDALAQYYPVLINLFYEIRVFTNGLVIVLFLIFEPSGLNGRWRDIKRYWTSWPFTY